MFEKDFSSEVAPAASQYSAERQYWLGKLSGELVKTGFPADRQRTTDLERQLDTFSFTITGELFSRLRKLSRASYPQIHVILAAAISVLLQKYTGQSDVVVAVPIYKQEIEGKFLNTVLALRSRLDSHSTFKKLLPQVKKTVMEANKNKNYPVERLIDKLDIRHDGYDFSLFDVAVLLENIHDKKYISHIPLNMVFSFLVEEEHMEGALEYNASIYEEHTVKRIIGHYRQLLQNLLNDVNAKLSHIGILTDDEKKQLLSDFNDTTAENRFTGTIHELFERQVEKTPDNIAAVGQGAMRHEITYRALNEKSNRLARWLSKNGVTGESVVGIMMDPSVDMVVVLIAILKAGGAYLPIEPGLPEERIRYMLEDSGAAALVSTGKTVENLSFTALQGFETRQGTQIKVTPPRPHIAGFDQLPRPNRRLVNLEKYKNKIGMASVTDCISFQATRGCPYHCLFCHKIWSKHHVYRDAENIYKEIEYYYKNGVTNFAFIDDCFNLNIEKSRKVFELIIKNRLKLQLFFPNGLRGDIMTPGYIDLMVEAGTRGINLSLESASPRFQKLLRKYLHLDKFKEVMDYIAARHPEVILEMASMHGFPTESQEEAKKTLDFIKSIKWLHFPYIHILKIFPNTEMEAFALEHGMLKKDILLSRNRAFHELPETLPFPKSFTRQYQADFLNNYFLNKERLMHVLPHQVKVLSETALVQKYNAYLPVEIKKIEDLIEFARLDELQVPENYISQQKEEEGQTIFDLGPEIPPAKAGAKKILLLDLSQHFSSHSMLYRVVEQPLGLISLLTYLKERFGDEIDGRVYKSGIDFDSFEELKALIDDYSPDLIGIRTLTFFREFFHETAALLRQWGVDVPIITGGPYASSDYDTILKDRNIDLAVLGEGEYTLAELVGKMFANDFRLPSPRVLDRIEGIAYPGHPTVVSRGREIILLDRINQRVTGQNCSSPKTANGEHNLAYVMYTSGSTGKPKGVMVEHRQVNNCISWMQDKFNLDRTAVIANRTDLTFDPSVWEIFWPLYIGGRVKILDKYQRKDAGFLIRLMARETALTMMYCPATLVKLMTYLLENKNGKSMLKLPWLIIGAEPIAVQVVKDFYKYYEGRIVNTYGPTECTINNTYYDLDRHCGRSAVPIGRPVANNQIYILDGNLQPVPLKIAGEICIAGNGAARGYIDNQEKTDLAFIKNPFGKGKLYKTGDVGRWLEDGTIEIMGRLDEQVKIRGYRIELGDIRWALSRHPAVSECIVLVKESGGPEKTIKTCKTCGITTQYPNVDINPGGTCNICELYSRNKQYIDNYFKTPAQLKQSIEEAVRHKQGQYDCLLLYAGGRGAAYALYRLVDMGFKVLAATYDNGYFAKSDIENIKKLTGSLGVDHVVLTHKNSDKIMGESINIASTVCRGCFHTSSSLAGRYAYQNGIPLIVGATLSRGQIIENRLLMFLQQGITEEKELDRQILNMQKSTPGIDKRIFDYIDIDIITDGSVYDKVKFLDFYRYFDITNPDMIACLNNRDPYWKNRKNFAVYSTNCPLKQVGDFGHLQERGYHYYGGATSWEKRLGHLSLENLGEDLTCKVTQKGYESFLKRIGFEQNKPVKTDTGDKLLCAYFVPTKAAKKNEALAAELRGYLAKEVPSYMIPDYFIQLEQIPLTSNGKIDRRALPEPEAKTYEEYIAPRNEIEKRLAAIWAGVLGSEKSAIGIDSKFFELGGNSLKATILISRIHKELNAIVPLAEIFKTPHIRGLAAYISEAAEEKYISIEPTEKKEYHPLSSAQRRLYILQQMDAEKGIAYNMPSVWQLQGDIDEGKMERIFHQLIRRHESLRTFFTMVNDGPVQRIRKEVEFRIEYYEPGGGEERKLGSEEVRKVGKEAPFGQLNAFSEETSLTQTRNTNTIIKEFIRPFDLSQAPLLRVELINVNEKKYMLMVDMHHIISDGLSIGIFVKEFMELYAGKILPQLRLQYKDYSEWHNRQSGKKFVKTQESYWLNQFAGEVPVLDLLADYPRPPVQDFAGAAIHFDISKEETAALKFLAREQDVTLFMLLLSLYTVLLGKLPGQEDIVVGTPIAGRRHTDLEGIMGMVVNTLALRNFPVGEKTFGRFLGEIKENTIKAFENQDYLYEDLVEEVEVQRDTSRNPLFDTMFVLQNMDTPAVPIPGLKVEPYRYESRISKFDLTLTALETEGRLAFTFEYCTKLFKKETIQRFTGFFKRAVLAVLENFETRLSGIEIISPEEKNRILMSFNDTGAEYPRDKTIHGLFAEQVERTPDSIALVGAHEYHEEKKIQITNHKLQTSHKLQITNTKPFTQADGINTGLGTITYKELNRSANRLAQVLREKGVQPDTIVGIKMERSIEMIVGILGILKAGGAYLPIDPEYPQERIDYMLKDSGAKILLTDLPEGHHHLHHSSNLHLEQFIIHHSNSLAYIIYTSGSTGKPKGVPVEHFPVVNLAFCQGKQFDINERDRILQFSSICFDASVEQIFISFFNGAVLVLLDKNTLLDPIKFEKFVICQSITHIHAVPFFLNGLQLKDTYNYGLKRIISGGDVCPVRLAERWSADYDFYNEYGPTETTVTSIEMLIGTVDKRIPRLPVGKPVSNTRVYILDKWMNVVPIGVVGDLYIGGAGVARGYLNNPVLTKDKFISAPALSHKPHQPGDTKKETGKKEIIEPSGYTKIHEDKKLQLTPNRKHVTLYKTGDLARWLPGGNIEFLGRKDSQVKIRGFRIELEEIESQLLTDEKIKEAIVIAREDNDDKYLCAYIVAKSGKTGTIDQSGLREHLANRLPDYMVPAYFVQLDNIPLTPNGKVDRKVLPGPEVKTGKNYIAPRNETEKKLADIWSGVLGIEKEKIGINDNFFHLGGHSLKAMVLASRINKEFNINVSLTGIFKTLNIHALAAYIKESVQEKYISIEPVEKRDYYPLSSAQTRLYILLQLDRESTVYNIPSVMILTGRLHRERIAGALRGLIRRHESLRTSFEVVKGEPIQRIHDEVEFDLDFHDLQDFHDCIKLFIRPFDLSRAPLLRVGLMKEDQQRYLLLIDMHHIISDGTSAGVFFNELMSLYGNQCLQELRVHYKDFSLWQTGNRMKDAISLQELYWLKEFSGEIPVLRIMSDYPRPAFQRFEGNSIRFQANEKETRALNQIAISAGTTLFMVLLALYNIFLAKISSQEDIVVGTPTAGRSHADLETMIGMFVNTLALRNSPIGEKTFTGFLSTVKKKTLQAFDNREYPFEKLVEKVAIERDMSRNPLFDVMFILQNISDPPANVEKTAKTEMAGLKITPYHQKNQTVKFDLTLNVIEKQGKLCFSFDYCTKLFKKETIRKFINYFNRIISSVIDNPGMKISQIQIITETEKQQILNEFNDTEVEYPFNKTVHELFVEQMKQTPHHIALIGQGGSFWEIRPPGPVKHPQKLFTGNVLLTYKELNRKSDQLACLLKEKGVLPGTIVGLRTERTVDMIIGILGILKTGSAYLPITREYPEERIKYILADSNIKIVVSEGNIPGNSFAEKSIDTILFINTLEKFAKKIKFWENVFNVEKWPCRTCGWGRRPLFDKPTGLSPVHMPPATFSSLAYVIYTSGSTGRPKGVMIRHDSLVNFIKGMTGLIDFKGTDKVLCLTEVTFDIFGLEILVPLTCGSTVIMGTRDQQLEPTAALHALEKEKATIFQATPSRLQLLLTYDRAKALKSLSILRYLLVGGEAFPGELAEQLVSTAAENGFILYNLYGPTETTIWSSAKNLTGRVPLTIGKPIANTYIYILDKYSKLIPPGIAGEICIAGRGLAPGYLNRPELTAEKFDQDKKLQIPNKHMSHIYKTGDWGRWLEDGDIEFLGRVDFQVKIRGHRIELTEIESCLLGSIEIKEVVVTDRESETGDKYLAAYFVAEKSFQAEELMEHLGRQLPGYMIPSYFVQLDRIPLTVSGKVDRKALPAPGSQGQPAGNSYCPPKTGQEKIIADIWSEFLGVDKIGINDNFFTIGGHSLQAVRVISRIREIFNLEISLRFLFENPTVHRLAGAITRLQMETIGKQDMEKILMQIENMTDQEAEVLLDRLNG